MRAGDTVYNLLNEELWIVACVDTLEERLSWCGWPEGWAEMKDVLLTRACTDAEHIGILREWAAQTGSDHRIRYAQRLLAAYEGMPS